MVGVRCPRYATHDPFSFCSDTPHFRRHWSRRHADPHVIQGGCLRRPAGCAGLLGRGPERSPALGSIRLLRQRTTRGRRCPVQVANVEPGAHHRIARRPRSGGKPGRLRRPDGCRTARRGPGIRFLEVVAAAGHLEGLKLSARSIGHSVYYGPLILFMASVCLGSGRSLAPGRFAAMSRLSLIWARHCCDAWHR